MQVESTLDSAQQQQASDTETPEPQADPVDSELDQ